MPILFNPGPGPAEIIRADQSVGAVSAIKHNGKAIRWNGLLLGCPGGVQRYRSPAISGGNQTPSATGSITSTFSLIPAVILSGSLAPGGFYDWDESSDGTRWFYWQQGTSAPYTIWMAIMDAVGNIVVSPQATNVTNSDLSPIAVHEFPVTNGGRSIGLLYSASGSPAYFTARDGKTFT